MKRLQVSSLRYSLVMHLDTLARDSTFLKQKLGLNIDTGFVRWILTYPELLSETEKSWDWFGYLSMLNKEIIWKAQNWIRREGAGGRTGHNRLVLQNSFDNSSTYPLLLQHKYTRVLCYRTVEAFKAVDPLLVSKLYQLYRWNGEGQRELRLTKTSNDKGKAFETDVTFPSFPVQAWLWVVWFHSRRLYMKETFA